MHPARDVMWHACNRWRPSSSCVILVSVVYVCNQICLFKFIYPQRFLCNLETGRVSYKVDLFGTNIYFCSKIQGVCTGCFVSCLTDEGQPDALVSVYETYYEYYH